jgi:ABC-2 type transport system ATP-binding protein
MREANAQDPAPSAAPADAPRGGDAAGAVAEPAIRCRGLRKVYDRDVVAVGGLDLEVRRGECFGLLGPNGAGKTTTIEILEGLLEPTEGEVSILGQRWGRSRQALRQRLGITLQETRLTEKLSVLETLRLFRSFYERGLGAEDVIERVQLGREAHRWVGKLSGGQRQRLALACALVGDPELLFLDEPTTGLDPSSRRQIWSLVREFQSRGGTLLLTTHYMDEAEKLCNRVAIVDRGQIIALGAPAELIRSLGAEHVVEFAIVSASAGGRAPGAENGADAGLARRLGPEAAKIASVRSARVEGASISLTVGEPHLAVPALLAFLEANALALVRLSTRHASLEDVFVQLTGRHLDDDSEKEPR